MSERQPTTQGDIMSFAYPAPPAVSGLNIAQRITQRRDQELDDRIERERLPISKDRLRTVDGSIGLSS